LVSKVGTWRTNSATTDDANDDKHGPPGHGSGMEAWARQVASLLDLCARFVESGTDGQGGSPSVAGPTFSTAPRSVLNRLKIGDAGEWAAIRLGNGELGATLPFFFWLLELLYIIVCLHLYFVFASANWACQLPASLLQETRSCM
jgi:hypothetical protein